MSRSRSSVIALLPVRCTRRLIISDAHSGLVSAIRESFPGASWQRCKVHFMRNILAYVPQKEKKSFAAVLKEIWLTPTAELAKSGHMM